MVQTAAEIFADAYVRGREMLVSVDQPGAPDEVEIAGCPIKMTKTPPTPGGRAPLLDEHRDEVLGGESPADAETAADD